MSAKKYELDMTKGSVYKNIITFAIPLMLSSLLQLFYNAADLVVVSRFAGSNAMASVGATSSVSALFVNFSIGLSLGAGIVVGRSFGARDDARISRAVHTSVFLGIVIGIVTCALGVILAKPLLELMGTPEGDVLKGAVLYMRIYFLGIPATLIYNFSAAVLRSVGDTKRPLYILSASGIVNVLLNLLLVIFFHMGVAGVAIATSVSNVISMIAVLLVLVRSEGSYRLVFSKIRVWKEELLEILKMGVPSGIQSSLFSLSNTVIQSAINSFGAAAVAGSAAGVNIEAFVYAVTYSFHHTTVTSVSQNHGAGNSKRIIKTIGAAVVYVTITSVILSGLCVLFADKLLGIYITDSAEAIEYGKLRIMTTVAFIVFCGIMDVFGGALRGLGLSTISMLNSLFGACVFRVLWVLFVLPLHNTFVMLMNGIIVSWILVIPIHIVSLWLAKKKGKF